MRQDRNMRDETSSLSWLTVQTIGRQIKTPPALVGRLQIAAVTRLRDVIGSPLDA